MVIPHKKICALENMEKMTAEHLWLIFKDMKLILDRGMSDTPMSVIDYSCVGVYTSDGVNISGNNTLIL
jgi:hypothetical protein